MPVECYATVSDIALCQRCPALFAYQIHRNEKSAWRIGIKGGEVYGSVFHKEISEKFFNLASNPRSPFFKEISFAASEGADSLEKVVREKFFIPFVESEGKNFTSAEILAMAQAVRVWLQGIFIFFENSRPVFMKPEGKLCGFYDFKDARLNISGRYDALIFNPKKAEVRLFEFKAFRKSDLTVPLAQSLIYAWLIKKSSGIIPSIEIIYLDEKRPEIFNSNIVKDLIRSGLPGLFRSVLDIILLRRLPEIMHDKNLCASCKFQNTCRNDMKKIFDSKRRGASMISLMIFFLAAIVITAQVFFFSNISAESVKEDRDIQSSRMQLASVVEDVKDLFKNDNVSRRNNYDPSSKKIVFYSGEITADYLNFYDEYKAGDFQKPHGSMPTGFTKVLSVDVFILDYTYKAPDDDLDYHDFALNWGKISTDKRIFPPMGENHYLIRVSKQMPAGNRLMIQALIESDDDKFIQKTYEEIWYQ